VVPGPSSGEAILLTAEEWRLILQALSAYQHHEDFRALYEKLASRQTRS
jgi:uncharacterized protein YoaH (UPF0181 family)